MDLGEFGAALRELDDNPDPDTFRFCGETFTVRGRIPSMLAMQLGASVTGKIPETEGLASVWESLRCSLTAPGRDGKPADDSEFDRLYKLAVARDVDLEDITRLTFKLFEAQAGRPTKQPSDSSAGPSSTSLSSSPSSTHPALAHLTPVAYLVG